MTSPALIPGDRASLYVRIVVMYPSSRGMVEAIELEEGGMAFASFLSIPLQHVQGGRGRVALRDVVFQVLSSASGNAAALRPLLRRARRVQCYAARPCRGLVAVARSQARQGRAENR